MTKQIRTDYGIIFFNCSIIDFHLLKHLVVLINNKANQEYDYYFGIKLELFRFSEVSSGMEIVLYFPNLTYLFKFYKFFLQLEDLSQTKNDLLDFHKEFETLDSFFIMKGFGGEISNFVFFETFFLNSFEFKTLYNSSTSDLFSNFISVLNVKIELLELLYNLITLEN